MNSTPTDNDKAAILKNVKRKIKKALFAHRFTNTSYKNSKATDFKKQVKSARDFKHPEAVGLSKELNLMAKQLLDL